MQSEKTLFDRTYHLCPAIEEGRYIIKTVDDALLIVKKDDRMVRSIDLGYAVPGARDPRVAALVSLLNGEMQRDDRWQEAGEYLHVALFYDDLKWMGGDWSTATQITTPGKSVLVFSPTLDTCLHKPRLFEKVMQKADHTNGPLQLEYMLTRR